MLSAEHAHSDLNGTIATGTFLTPCMLQRSDFASSYTPELPPASPQPVRAAAQAAPTPGDGATSAAEREGVHPALSILTEAARLASSATPTTPSALVAAVGSEHASNYAIAPHVIEEVDLELLQEFLGRIGPARIKNDYRARCSKSGRRFIVQFLQDINDHPMGTNSATAMQKIIDGMLTAGCEATVASFLALTEKVRVWNKCQVKAKILPEDQLAEKFKDLVIRMGEVAENKLQITINNAVMQTLVRKGEARIVGGQTGTPDIEDAAHPPPPPQLVLLADGSGGGRKVDDGTLRRVWRGEVVFASLVYEARFKRLRSLTAAERASLAFRPAG